MIEDPEMGRRALLQALGLGLVGAGESGSALAQPGAAPVAAPQPAPKDAAPKVAMLIYPRMVLQDLVGPLTVMNLLRCDVHLVWKTLEPVGNDLAIPIVPTDTFETCPRDLDVLFVPGGIVGTTECMKDASVLDFLADRGARARYVTSVCTGALVLGAAGLLQGYKAATHWAVMDILPVLGAIPVHKRVVEDRNRMTGGGVTAGIDFGLLLASRLRDEEAARTIQLTIEYAPEPPFHAGNPAEAGPELTAAVKMRRKSLDAAALAAAQAAAKRLGIG